MKVSAKLCFCLLLPFFVFFVTGTFALCSTRRGLTFNPVFPNLAKYLYDPLTTNEVMTAAAKEKKKPTPQRSLEFNQKLDHFDPTNNEYFKQRYFVYEGDYKQGNPVFLLVGGTGELEFCDLEKGIWNDFAIESSALLLALEHRMYGESYPSNRDFSTENLLYLNTEQALVDLAYFIDELTVNNPENIIIPRHAKWIAFGSSYGGTLAALLKLKYPQKITAAMTINAPLLPTAAFEGLHNLIEHQCKKEKIDVTVKQAFAELKKGFNSFIESEYNRQCAENQFKALRATFNLCDDFLSKDYEVKDHKVFLFWSLTTVLGIALQWENESERTIKTRVIDVLLNEKEIPIALNRLGEAVKLVLRSYNIKCLNVNYKNLIDSYRNTSTDAEKKLDYILYTGLGNRQTLYRHCSQWGQFKTFYNENGLFPELVPLNFYVNICINVFTPKKKEQDENSVRFNAIYLENAMKRTKMHYGGREINVNKVLFILYDDDYWTRLGYAGRKPWDKITEEDSVTVLLKTEDETNNGGDEWNFILKKLKNWSGVETTKKNNPNTNGQVPVHIKGAISS